MEHRRIEERSDRPVVWTVLALMVIGVLAFAGYAAYYNTDDDYMQSAYNQAQY